MKLVSLIKEFFEPQSYRETNIPTEIKLQCLIRWLSGGSYLDILDIVLISSTSFYRFSYTCVSAILNCQSLHISLPMSNEDINRCCMGFNACSSHKAILGCVGCIDGYLVHINAPNDEEVSNVHAYFSGRYKKFGINIQCVCDSMCRFLYVSVSLPGSHPDINAFRSTCIPQYLEDTLPNDYFSSVTWTIHVPIIF